MDQNQFEYLQQLNSQVFDLYQQGQYSEALNIAEQALNTARSTWSEDNEDLAASINNFASLLEIQGRLSEAEPYYIECLEMLQRLFPDGHDNIAKNLNNLGTFFCKQGRLSESERYYRDALTAWRNLIPLNLAEFSKTMSNLGCALEQEGKFYDAETCHLEALEIREGLYQQDNVDTATSLNNLGIALEKQGRVSESLNFFYRALEMLQRLFPDGHIQIPYSQNNIGKILKDRGRLTEAEDYLYNALEMRRRLLPAMHHDIAFSLNSFGSVLGEQGKTEEAINYYLSSLKIRTELFPDGHPETAFTLHNLAIAFQEKNQFEEAESYFRSALSMRQGLLSKKHLDVASSLNSLGTLLIYQSRLAEAELCLLNSYETLKNIFPNQEHPELANVLDNFGELYLKRENIVKAKEYYQQSLSIRKKLFFEAHPDLALSHINLGRILAYESHYEEAFVELLRAVAVETQITKQIFAFSSESDRLLHLDKIKATTEFLISLVATYLQDNLEAVQSVFEVVLQRKGLSAIAKSMFNAAIYEQRYQHLEEKWQKWRSLGEQIIHLSFNQGTLNNIELNRLQEVKEEARRLEKYLASQVPEIQLQKRELNLQVVAERLPNNSVLIEFVRFQRYNFQNRDLDPSYYLAFVIPAKQPDKLAMKVLGRAGEIEHLVNSTRQQATSHFNIDNGKFIPFYSEKLDDDSPFGEDESSAEQANSLQYCYLPDIAIRLRELIFDPLRKHFEDGQQLFVVPDGQLSLIPFQLLPLNEEGEELLIDRYQISYLSVTQDLFRSDLKTQHSASSPLVIADPKFYLDSCTTENTTRRRIEVLELGREKEKTKKLLLKRLKAMGVLGKKVASILNVKPYLQEDALATHLKNGQCPNILFIGTHGLYLPQKRKLSTESVSLNSFYRYQSISQTENPMLRSALTFAGAGTWLDGSNLSPEVETGFIFAQEIAELDLWANEMTVLLACNSGMGDISIGEGVFGLRRAFAVAGAKTLIMSLWSVPVKASALLIERFFYNLQQSGMKRHLALQEAQNYIRNLTISELLQSDVGLEVITELAEEKNLTVEFISHWDKNQKNQKPLSHPFYWAAWICQGEITSFSDLSGF